MPSKNNHYEELEVTRNAGAAVIRGAYKALAQQHHPDKANGEVAKALAHERMQRLNAALDTLGDSAKRAQYDRDLANSERSAEAKSAPSHPAPSKSPVAQAPVCQQGRAKPELQHEVRTKRSVNSLLGSIAYGAFVASFCLGLFALCFSGFAEQRFRPDNPNFYIFTFTILAIGAFHGLSRVGAALILCVKRVELIVNSKGIEFVGVGEASGKIAWNEVIGIYEREVNSKGVASHGIYVKFRREGKDHQLSRTDDVLDEDCEALATFLRKAHIASVGSKKA